jgi:glycosyltransferase involved in cell wall biosynthesis
MEIRFFFRKSFPFGNYSIEKVFDTLIKFYNFDRDYSFKKVVIPRHSIGFLNRVINIIYAFLNQSYINHVTGDTHYLTLLLRKNNTILTIHDLVILNRSTGFKYYLYFYFWYYFPIKKSRYITVISETIKKELISLFPFVENKLFVVYNPLTINVMSTARKFNKICPTILHIGTTENKNLINSIKALSNINCSFRIIGKLSVDQLSMLNSSNINYSNVYNLSENELLNEYLNADLLLFISTYEGFGLPIIEAQSLRLPVLTSNISSMPEISGLPFEYLVNPYDVVEIENHILKIISDSDYRDLIVSLGLINVKRFDPRKIINDYKRIYNLVS